MTNNPGIDLIPGISKFKQRRVLSNPSLISPRLYCSICLQVFQDPVRIQCGHTFCFICIQHWALLKHHCPNCKKPFGCRKPEKDLLAIALVDELPVRCVYNCGWEGVEALRKKHQRCCELKPRNEKSGEVSEVEVEVVEVNDLEEQEIQIMDEEID